MKTHDKMIAEWKEDPEFRKAYDTLEEEFALFDELYKARNQAGLTQAEVAKRMGTKTPAVARLEAGGGREKHSPSLTTLRKYAAAVGCRLEIKLIPVPQVLRHKREARSGNKQGSQIGGRSTSQRRRRAYSHSTQEPAV